MCQSSANEVTRPARSAILQKVVTTDPTNVYARRPDRAHGVTFTWHKGCTTPAAEGGTSREKQGRAPRARTQHSRDIPGLPVSRTQPAHHLDETAPPGKSGGNEEAGMLQTDNVEEAPGFLGLSGFAEARSRV